MISPLGRVPWKTLKWPVFVGLYPIYCFGLVVAVVFTTPDNEPQRCVFMELTSPDYVTLPDFCPPRTPKGS